MRPPENYSNLFLDMNAFFASCEQQVQSELRGKPVVVAPYTGNTGCCIAKSYEAKAFGIGTGTLVGEAKKLCPQVVVLESRPELYMFYHRQILKVLDKFTPALQIMSVDEFNLPLSGSECSKEASFQLGQKIKTAIREKVGDHLFCSVGIGPSSWTAKVAAELKKPNGLVILALEELSALWRSIPLTDLPGINIRMAAHLKYRKIKTPFDLYNQPLFNLVRWFGHWGRVWHYKMRGYEIDEVKSPTRSIGHQHVLAPEFRSIKAARKVLMKLVEKCGARLRNKNMVAGGVAVYVKFLEGGRWHRHATLGLTSSSSDLRRIAFSLYDACWIQGRPLKISVTLFDLKQTFGRQTSLFRENEKEALISKTIDEINDKFGKETITPAAMLGTEESAPDRISFGNPDRLSF